MFAQEAEALRAQNELASQRIAAARGDAMDRLHDAQAIFLPDSTFSHPPFSAPPCDPT